MVQICHQGACASKACRAVDPRRVFIGSVSRVPFGDVDGVYRKGGLRASDLAAHTIRRALTKANVTDDLLSLVGCTFGGQAAQSFFEPNFGRYSAQKGGVPDSAFGATGMAQCGSGFLAAWLLYAAIRLGNANLGSDVVGAADHRRGSSL